MVDDNEVNREILLLQLTSWQTAIELANDGLSGIMKIKQAQHNKVPFDLVILDWHMPNMDGIEVAEIIVNDPEIKTPKLVMLSSAAFDEESSRARNAGIQRYLIKPVKQKALYNCLIHELGQPDFIKLNDSVSTDQSALNQALNNRPNRHNNDIKIAHKLKNSAISEEIQLLNMTILLVEDNLVNQEVAKGLLEIMGCNVQIANNGKEALMLYHKANFDLILMDCHMPIMDGIEATKEIRMLELTSEKYRHIPIIALTANVQQGIEELCNDAGMDDYLSKPFERKQLERILLHWLNTSLLAKNANELERIALTKVNSIDSGNSANDTEIEEPVLQRKALDNILALHRPGTPNILGRIITIFFDTSPALLSTIQLAVKETDRNKLFNAAHALKSASANLGAVKLSKICHSLENKENSFEASTELLEALKYEYSAVKSALKAELMGLSDE